MKIRAAKTEDLPAIERIYDAARAYMARSGNPHQWGDSGYPERELLEEDIQKRRLFVMEEAGAPHAVFAFMLGDDPTYAVIEDGQWPNSLPYGTIHRIASDGVIRGAVAQALRFGLERIDQVRIDTHHDNKTMQHVVAKLGFRRCGIIYLENGDPRIAYQFSKEDSHENK